VKPPAVNKNKKPIANKEAVVGLEDPPYRVETQLNIFMPVGTAITIVAAVKYALVSTSRPTENIW
jgi:hypothetical protein